MTHLYTEDNLGKPSILTAHPGQSQTLDANSASPRAGFSSMRAAGAQNPADGTTRATAPQAN
jgi:hypothetical protein